MVASFRVLVKAILNQKILYHTFMHTILGSSRLGTRTIKMKAKKTIIKKK